MPVPAVLVDVDTVVTDVPDAYTRLTELLEIPGTRGRIRDAVMRALTATVEVYYSESRPEATDAGDQLAPGAGYGSPWFWRIERIWVRELVAAAGARLVFAGIVEEGPRA